MSDDENNTNSGGFKTFGNIASGLGDLGKLYGAWQGAKAAKEAQKLAEQNSMFTQAFDVANLSQALQSQGAINQFMGGTGQDPRYQLSTYLSPEVQNKYSGQSLFGSPQGNQQQLPNQMMMNPASNQLPAYGGFSTPMNAQPNYNVGSAPAPMQAMAPSNIGFSAPMTNAPVASPQDSPYRGF